MAFRADGGNQLLLSNVLVRNGKKFDMGEEHVNELVSELTSSLQLLKNGIHN